MLKQTTLCFLIWTASAGPGHAGPYPEPGIYGFIDPVTWRHADPQEPNAIVHPLFRAWATDWVEYAPSDTIWTGPGLWNDPNKALGPVTGDNFDIVSLGELEQEEIERGDRPGQITLVFGDPCNPADSNGIRNGVGYDFAVFENAFLSQITTATGSIEGQMLAELAYVEVSSNGRDFARFPSVSLTPDRIGPYGTLEISDVHNLAGRHPNANGTCIGTPFDLDDLRDHAGVVSASVDLNDIRYVRIVDIPGSGDFVDAATTQIDPETWPQWSHYLADHPIYDDWPSWGSGGFDLEAVGVLGEQQYAADINLDGIVDVADLALFASAWNHRFGQTGWLNRCDLSQQEDGVVNGLDFAAFAAQWRHVEQWRTDLESQ